MKFFCRLGLASETETNAAPRRRLWLLLCWLTLPWLVCPLALALLLSWTPNIEMSAPDRPPWQRPGLVVDLQTGVGHTGGGIGAYRTELIVGWQLHRQGDLAWWWIWEGGGLASSGINAQTGQSWFVAVWVWWLLPFPVLWSAVHLWRWVRRVD
ncbi:MAG: hypothetical protein AAF907_01005 [Planctomycetota bacterium]